MKMFTKLFKLTLTLLLLLAIVVVQAQQGNKKASQKINLVSSKAVFMEKSKTAVNDLVEPIHFLSPSQELPEGPKPLKVGNQSKEVTAQLFYFEQTSAYFWHCPDSYGDEEFGVRFTSIAPNSSLTGCLMAFYSQLGDPDINVNVYDVGLDGFPNNLLGTVVVPFADIGINTGYTEIDLSSLNLSFDMGEEFYITYSTVGGVFGSVEMNILSDGGGQGVERSVEYYGAWGTMANDWGLDVEFFIVANMLIDNDDCADATPVGEVADLGFSTTNATFDGPGGCQTAPNIWFDYTVAKDGDLTIHTNGSSYDTKIALYDSFDCGTMIQLACDDNGGTGTGSLISVTGVTIGDQFKIEVGGAGTDVGDGLLTISVVVPCEVPCPPGSLAENEAQIPDDGDDVTNGGCNMLPNTPLYSPIASGDTYCGQTNTYTTGGGTGNARDTDWYRFEALSSPDAYWNFNIEVTAEFDVQVLLIDAGADDCTDYSIVTALTAGTCEPLVLNGDYPSGIYYIWVGPQTATGNLYPYGSGPWDYTLSYTGTELGAPVATLDPMSYDKLIAPEETDADMLTIGNTGTYDLTYSAITSGTYNGVFEDQFDTYAAGAQLAVQNPTDWTTWSDAPGSTEDPVVSDAQAYTGSNSVLITGVNDCVHLIGNYTSGSYRVSHRMYVEPGNVGYFNTLLSFDAVNAVYEWGMQVAFETDGTATLDAGVFAAATFNYTPGTWMLNEVYVDLDNDYAEYWFNGNFIWSWQWSIGTGEYNTNQLAANNFFAYTGVNSTDNPLFYIDDYKIEQAVNDWLTLDGGLGVSGTIPVGDPDVNIALGFDATGKAVGTYTKNITIVTNELGGSKTSYSIPVTMVVGYSVAGNLYYGETDTKPIGTDATVTLTPDVPPGAPITLAPGAAGDFDFRPLDVGDYLLTGASTKAWGGMTTFDATLILRYVGGVTGYDVLTNLQKRAADVNMTNTANGITTFDATIILRTAAAGNVKPAQWTAPDFIFDGPYPSVPYGLGLGVTVGGPNANLMQNLRTLCSGDLNGSYNPPAK